MAAESHQKRAQLIEGAAVRSCFTWDGKPETPPVVTQPASYPPNVNVFARNDEEIQDQARREAKTRSSGVKVFYRQANNLLTGETGAHADFTTAVSGAESSPPPQQRPKKRPTGGLWKWQQRESSLTMRMAKRTAQARSVRDRVKARQELASDRQRVLKEEIAKATTTGMSEVLYGFEPSCKHSPPSPQPVVKNKKRAAFTLPTASSKSHRDQTAPFSTSTYGGLIFKPPPPDPKLNEAYNQKPYFYSYDPMHSKTAAPPLGKPCWVGRKPPPLQTALQKEVHRVRRELAAASVPKPPVGPKVDSKPSQSTACRPLSARVKRKIQEISDKFLPMDAGEVHKELRNEVRFEVRPPQGQTRPQTAPQLRAQIQ